MKELPDNYFLDVDDEMLDYLERHGEECIRELQQSNTTNKENGYKLLSILIVGIGSSFMFLTQRQNFDFMGAGIGAFMFYWSLCATYLVIRVVAVHKRSMISAPPYLLYSDAYKGMTKDDFEYLETVGFKGEHKMLAVLRRYRLKTLCKSADEMGELNKQLGEELTRVRIATIITPACAIAISALTYFFL